MPVEVEVVAHLEQLQAIILVQEVPVVAALGMEHQEQPTQVQVEEQILLVTLV